MDDLTALLSTSPVFREVSKQTLEEIAPLFQIRSHPAGSIVLHQGASSSAVYLLLSGRLAVRIRRGRNRETVAWIQPPEIFGELSLLTGRPCVADVEVAVDAEIAVLEKGSFPSDLAVQRSILGGLARTVAERLQVTVAGGGRAPRSPVVLLQADEAWEAPQSFPAGLALALARETGMPTLLVKIGKEEDSEIRPIEGLAAICAFPVESAAGSLRDRFAANLTKWAATFRNVVLSPSQDAAAIGDAIGEFATCRGFLLGPGGLPPPEPTEKDERLFVVQSASAPTLPVLNGARQLIWESAVSETAYRAGHPVTPRFRRTIDSIARLIAGTQVGLALGGGAAWGWAHIGVLQVLEEAGLPIDLIAGCSMGSIIGGLRASGKTVAELVAIADYWRTRKLRFVEWRLWRFCLLNERMVRRALMGYLDERQVNQTEIPFWANAVDIQTGKEFSFDQGPLVDCLRGSIGLPGLFPPLKYSDRTQEHLLVDAGIMDPVPVRLVRKMGAHFAVAVNAMVPPSAQKVTSHYPLNLVEILSRCMFVMGHEIGEAAAESAADVVFTPDLTRISMLEFGRSAEIIESGRVAAAKHLPSIQALYARLKSAAAFGETVAPG